MVLDSLFPFIMLKFVSPKIVLINSIIYFWRSCDKPVIVTYITNLGLQALTRPLRQAYKSK